MTSCGDDEEPTTPPAVENTSALCQDGTDNDGDGLTDCDDPECQDFSFCEVIPATETISGSLGTRTLTNDRIWIMDGFTYVSDGDVVTIDPGTIIKAEDGQGSDATAFIVARGGEVIANGTATSPIIFTSINDNIALGETASSGLSNDISGSGQWGGVIILGNAPISAGSSSAIAGVSPVGSEATIEGVPASLSYSRYGGSVAGDDSGEYSYISIRYTGTQLGANNEIQGLTLGGVGSGTIISDIEIFGSKDDGIECFGGTVDVTNLLVAYQEDDAIDIDQSYDGTIDNALVLNFTVDRNPSDPNDPNDTGALEIDGPEQPGTNDGGTFTLTNATIMNMVSPLTDGFPGQLKSGAQGEINNTAFVDFSGARLFEVNSVSAFTLDTIEFDDATGFENNDSNPADLTTMSISTGVDPATVGADATAFDWTFAKSLSLF